MAKRAAANNAVARQYEKWVYPFPIQDLNAPEARARRDGGDYERNFYTFWPNQEKCEDLDVLIAGCGSNAAARYAFNHPTARVTGIDLSASSLAHENFLKDKHKLDNLTLHQGRLEDIGKFKKTFDFIDVSGVLHHLPDPVSGLKALGSVLRPEGTIAIMVYGKYGRTGVYMMQEVFRLMELGQSEEDVATVKKTINLLPKRHPVNDYLMRTQDTKYDAGLVDTFLHRQDRAYTVAECIDFAKQAGMTFMNWWDNIFYYPNAQLNMNDPMYAKINALPDEALWQFMELYNGTLGQHGFSVCHTTRDKKTYRIDFSGKAFMNYIPDLRCQEVKTGQKLPAGSIELKRAHYPVYTLGAQGAALFRQIDGKKSIRDCLKDSGVQVKDAKDGEALCKLVFQHLWRLSYVFLRIPA